MPQTDLAETNAAAYSFGKPKSQNPCPTGPRGFKRASAREIRRNNGDRTNAKGVHDTQALLAHEVEWKHGPKAGTVTVELFPSVRAPKRISAGRIR